MVTRKYRNQNNQLLWFCFSYAIFKYLKVRHQISPVRLISYHNERLIAGYLMSSGKYCIHVKEDNNIYDSYWPFNGFCGTLYTRHCSDQKWLHTCTFLPNRCLTLARGYWQSMWPYFYSQLTCTHGDNK